MHQAERSAEPRSGPRRPLGRHGADDRDDSALLAACRNGDARAWETIIDRYERLIFSVALRNGLSREDAADVTQTTFLALLDSIGRLRDDQSLPYWLMTVARRQAWRVRDRVQADLARTWPDAEADDPIDEYERIAAVHEGLARLGDPCRELLIALYFDAEEPSYRDIAHRMGRAIGSLGSMRARCLAKLRAILDQDIA